MSAFNGTALQHPSGFQSMKHSSISVQTHTHPLTDRGQKSAAQKKDYCCSPVAIEMQHFKPSNESFEMDSGEEVEQVVSERVGKAMSLHFPWLLLRREVLE